MSRLPWTKFQDFYLRLGLLKVLVAILDPNRRSAAKEALSRRLQELLFAPARGHEELWYRVEAHFPWFGERSGGRSRRSPPTTLEALLLLGACPSQLFAVTARTTYKILDWARDLQLIGPGNQISETGVLLRGLLPQESLSEFLRGNPLAWNPFVLSERERLLLLFHLCEIDELTIELLGELTRPGIEEPIEAAQASAMTCRAFFRVLDRARGHVGPGGLPALRRGRELASVMAEELELQDLVASVGATTRRRLPRAPRIPAKGGLKFGGTSRQQRRTTKNADHQTIPRFEQLVDLGFLAKPIPDDAGPKEIWDARRRWRYVRLPTCHAWARGCHDFLDAPGRWQWRQFASMALGSGLVQAALRREHPAPDLVAGFLWKAYEAVHRQVGHTPFHSVALIAMIEAAVTGLAIEMKDFHELMLAIKNREILEKEVFFASGNEIDKMFVVIRPGFVEAVEEHAVDLGP